MKKKIVKVYEMVRIDKTLEPGYYRLKLAKGFSGLDAEGNSEILYLIDDSTRTKKRDVKRDSPSLATTPSRTIKIPSRGYRRSGY